MPLLKIVIERIIINTYTEMVCRCPFQSWKLYLKGSPLTLEQNKMYSYVDMFVTKTSRKGLEVFATEIIGKLPNTVTYNLLHNVNDQRWI